MELPIQILIVLLPSVIILFITHSMMKNNTDAMRTFFQEEIKLRRQEIKSLNQNITGPLRVQAYERMILFLERIAPDSLVLRMHKSDMNARQLHGEVLRGIRSEYEHNLSQQVYLSIGAWKMILTAKEETAKLVNLTMDSNPAATGLQLGQEIIENASKLKRLPTEVAIEYLKKEFADNF